MSTIDFGTPHPPHMRDPAMFIVEMLIGFVILLGVTVFVDKLGTALFHKGFAKPFYIKGHRIHHSILFHSPVKLRRDFGALLPRVLRNSLECALDQPCLHCFDYGRLHSRRCDWGQVLARNTQERHFAP